MPERNKQKQIWSDIEFAKKLEEIKAKRLLVGKPVNNLGQLTKEMLACPSFQDLEKELLELDKKLLKKSGIKFDGVLQ